MTDHPFTEPALPLSANLARKMESAPPHVLAGLEAYRAALRQRHDWLRAVWAAIDAAVAEKERVPPSLD